MWRKEGNHGGRRDAVAKAGEGRPENEGLRGELGFIGWMKRSQGSWAGEAEQSKGVQSPSASPALIPGRVFLKPDTPGVT